MPGNFDEPSHTVREALQAEAPYAEHLGALGAPLATPSSYDAATYLRTLRAMFTEVDAWETTYLHVLRGEDPVFTWISGTSARPALAALGDDLRPRFEAELKQRLRAAYPDSERRRGAAVPSDLLRGSAMSARRVALHHVQVSCPADEEEATRAFWSGVLGLSEVDKPESLRSGGGCWFRAFDVLGRVSAEVHVGVEQDFRPARRAHPALVVDDLAAVAARLAASGHPVDLAERHTFPGHERLHTADPFGNRVEILMPVP